MEEIYKIIENHEISGSSGGYIKHFPRTYLIAWLSANTVLTRKRIGELFNRDHSTVVFCIKKHNDLSSLNDELYLKNTELVREEIRDREFIMSTLTDDIINCNTLPKLKELQRKLEAGAYIFNSYAGDKITYEFKTDYIPREVAMGAIEEQNTS